MAKISFKQDRKDFCALLVQSREDANLTQEQVSATGIVSQSELSKMENGHKKVEFIVLQKLAELYKKDISYYSPKKQKK